MIKAFLISLGGLTIIQAKSFADTQENVYRLEETIVTAQKREQQLIDTPIAITVLTQASLHLQNVSSLGDLQTISSLNGQPYANTPSSMVIAIRGIGPGDIVQTTRDSSVGVYVDEIYLEGALGLDMELPELDRIEILRGPQGTLFGRNATAGAISIVSKRPTGKFDVSQTLTTGNYGLNDSKTHINLPKFVNINSKLDLLYTERDGWVDNTASGESDYNTVKKTGFRFDAEAFKSDITNIRYNFAFSNTQMSQNYFQFHRDFLGEFGNEPKRQTKTRNPVTSLSPTKTLQSLHTLTIDRILNDKIAFKSLSSVRSLKDHTRNNYGGVLYFNGLIEAVDVEQEQLSQEFRLIGSHSQLNWVAGVYHQQSQVDEKLQQLFSLDIFGLINPTAQTAIDPPTNFDVLATGTFLTPLEVNSDISSTALYGQVTWTPQVLKEQLEVTFGIRFSDDRKSGKRSQGGFVKFDIEEKRSDPTYILNYHWYDNLSTYAKWSNAYRSGGVNVRSPSLKPFDTEKVDTYEIGVKTEIWDRRLRVNTALFATNIDGMFIDVFDPTNLAIADTINARNKVEVNGAEIEAYAVLSKDFSIGMSYTYLDGQTKKQPNSLANNTLEDILLTQTPRHAGSITIDYGIELNSIGYLLTHMEVISTAPYHHYPTGGIAHPDSYTLFNGRIELTNMPISKIFKELSFAIWGRNLFDEQYIDTSFGIGGVSTIHSFGEPRTIGLEAVFKF